MTVDSNGSGPPDAVEKSSKRARRRGRPQAGGRAKPAAPNPESGASSRLYGALDLGTNNCRLLVAVPTGQGRFKVIDAFSRIVRLGDGIDPAAAALRILRHYGYEDGETPEGACGELVRLLRETAAYSRRRLETHLCRPESAHRGRRRGGRKARLET